MALENHFISVIMPVFKVEQYIARAIESVLNQTYTNFELLVVDDGSPDNSVQVAKQFLEKDSRIRILHKPNGGLSDARNFGMEHSIGQFIYFIDSDDWIEPTLLETALTAIRTHHSKLVVFGYQLETVDEYENPIQTKAVFAGNQIFEKQKHNLSIDPILQGLLGYAWNKLYDATFLKENRLQFPKGVSLVEDILFNSQVYCLLDKIVVLDKPLYHYMNRQVVTLIKMFHKNSFELYLLKCEALNRFYSSWAIPENSKQELLASCMFEGIRYCGNNLLVYGTNLSDDEKFGYFKTMVDHPQTKRYASHYRAISLTDKIYKVLVTIKLTQLLFFLLKRRKQ